MFQYKEFLERTPDTQYRDLLKLILLHGTKVYSQMEEESFMVLGHLMRFNLKNGFPIITERDLVGADRGKPSQFYLAIGELCAFLNGARTLEQMKKFG